MNKCFYNILFLLVLIGEVKAQDASQIQIELPKVTTKANILSVEENGVIYFFQKEKKSKKDNSNWRFINYNTSFEKNWVIDLPINHKYIFENYYYEKGSLYLLFSYTKKKVFRVVRMNVQNGSYTWKDINSFSKFQVYTFKVVNNKIFLSGALYSKLALFHIDYKTGRLKALSAAFRGDTHIESIEIDTIGENVNIVFVNKLKKESSLIIKTFDYEGFYLSEVKVEKENKNILTGRISYIDGKEKIIIGTYSSNEKTFPKGMYVAKYVEGEISFFTFHEFTEMNNFFVSVNDDDKEEIIQKIREIDEKRGMLEYNFRLFTHDLIRQGNKFLLVADVYYPIYREETTTYFDSQGLPVTSHYVVFDGWQYSHALVGRLSGYGALEWNESFKIDKAKSMRIQHHVNVINDEDRFLMTYIHNGNIITDTLSNDGIIKQNEIDSIEVEEIDDPFLISWYQDVFIYWGEKVLPKSVAGTKKKVLLFQKFVIGSLVESP